MPKKKRKQRKQRKDMVTLAIELLKEELRTIQDQQRRKILRDRLDVLEA